MQRDGFGIKRKGWLGHVKMTDENRTNFFSTTRREKTERKSEVEEDK